jgi:hypothetical protein
MRHAMLEAGCVTNIVQALNMHIHGPDESGDVLHGATPLYMSACHGHAEAHAHAHAHASFML